MMRFASPVSRRTALLGLLAASARAQAGLGDVLQRPALASRRVENAPLLRLTRTGKRLVAVGEHGMIALSDDQGTSWRQAKVPVSITMTGVQFTSELRGFAIGHSAVVLRTDDGGESWTIILDGRKLALVMQGRGAELATLSSADNPAVKRAWSLASQVTTDGPDKPLLALDFADDLHGRVVGAFGIALQTSDAGQTWRSFADAVPNPRNLHIYAVTQIGERVFVAGEQGLFAKSDDATRNDVTPTFEKIDAPYRGSFFALSPLAGGDLLLAGLRGTILRFGTNGSFRVLESGTAQGIVSIARLTSGRMVLLDQSGKLFIATELELNFRPQVVSPDRVWLSVVDAADGTLIGTSFDGLARLKPQLQSK